MRGPLDTQRVLVPPEGRRPAGLQPGVDTKLLDDGELQERVRVFGMGPHRQLSPRFLDDIAHQVIEADVALAECSTGLLHALHIPGDGVEALAEARVELADGRLLRSRDTGQLYRLHDAVANSEQ